jgi:NADH-ubiquinone oxidoreductase chain 5
VVCLPFYLRLLTVFVCLFGGWFGYELSKFSFGSVLLSLFAYKSTVFSGSMWFMPYYSTYGVSSPPLLLGYNSLKISDLGWTERLGGQGIYWLLIGVSRVNQWWQYNNLRVFLMFFVIWVVVLMFIIVYLNSLCRAWYWRCHWGLEVTFEYYLWKLPLSLQWKCNVFLNYINRNVNGI